MQDLNLMQIHRRTGYVISRSLVLKELFICTTTILLAKQAAEVIN